MAKILIVDDDPDITEASKMFLEQDGHEVTTAGNRQEGLKAVELTGPDLLVLDVMMDEADDGIAMAQDLRRQGFDKPILMLTSLNKISGFDYDKDSDLVPVDDYQTKPIEPKVLVSKVRELLNGKE